MTTMRASPSVVTSDARRWDAYVAAHPRGSVYHLSDWTSILHRAYGYRPRYLALDVDGRIRGVMPLFSRGGPRGRLSSMPVARTAGPLGDSVEIEAALLERARLLQEEIRVRRTIVRSTREGYAQLARGWRVASDQPTWRLELPADADELYAMLRRRSSNVARSIRKAERSGVRVREGTSADDLRRFYELYLTTMRRHRSLPRSLRQLELTRRALAPRGIFRLWLAEIDGTAIGGGVFHAFGDTLELLYNASDERRLDVRPNHALYAEAMRWCIANGVRRFDFGGATEGTSLARFKAQWGAEPLPIYIYATGAAAPRNAVLVTGDSGDAGPQRLLDDAWGRTPLLLTRMAGAVTYRVL